MIYEWYINDINMKYARYKVDTKRKHKLYTNDICFCYIVAITKGELEVEKHINRKDYKLDCFNNGKPTLKNMSKSELLSFIRCLELEIREFYKNKEQDNIKNRPP